MCPLDSASAMKRSGARRPRVGCCQRISASTPVIRSVSSSTSGWYSSNSSSRSSARPSSLPSSMRSTSCARMTGSKRATRPLPASLAAYIARSALPRTSSAVASGPGHSRPRLADETIWRPSRTSGGSSARRMRSATCAASSGPERSSSRTANSSPPSRAAVSWARRQVASRLRGRAQQLVADRVAEAVVDRLEVVEIDEDHRELTAAGAWRARAPASGDPRTAPGWRRPVRSSWNA